MCRIHQADDAVVDIAGEIGDQVSGLVFVAQQRHPRRGFGRLGSTRKAGARRPRFRHEDPDKAIVFFARVAAGVNAIHSQLAGAAV